MSTGRYQISFLNHAGKGLILFILFSLFFIQVAAAANPQIKLTTNRYVILDDPNSGFSSVTAKADTGFGIPGSWNSDVWKGESTTVRGVALVLDEKGLPKSGVTVTFAVLDWDDASPRTLKSDINSKTGVTDANGLATASFDLNSEQQYGRWKITARATVNGVAVSSDSNFVYNWWGCQNCHGKPFSEKGEDKGYPDKVRSGDKLSPYDPYSPYITGRDFHNTMYTGHHLSGEDLVEGECWACHNSYDRNLHLGQVDKVNSPYPGKGTPSTYGVHENLECASCHSIIGRSESGSQTIKSCDASGCHQGASAFNPNVMRETVVATSPSIYVNYSAQDLNPGKRSLISGIPTAATFLSNPLTGARAHTSATIQDIPCTVCHGPMHNVTKPDITTVSKNKVTEDSQCTSCHQPKKHSQSNPVYCTACHSQDAHKIQILGKDGTYKNRGSSGAITISRSDCTECHKIGPANTSLGSLKTRDPLAYTNNFDPAGKYNTQHPTADCANSCHNTTDFHNISKAAGGPDCLICHDSTGSAIHRVDGNSITAGIHANLNTKTPADPNSKCWGCHQSDGSKPLNSMGDIFDRPYKCIDCHLFSGQKAGAYGAFIVDEHYPSGKDLRALLGNGSLDACILCHNKTQMKVDYLSPDNIFTNYSLVSHYGKKRIDMLNAANETKCAYCHQNTSEFNNVFQKNSNTQITHDNGQNCLNCHREQGSIKGRIHDSSLIGGGGPDCMSCHSGSGRAKVDVQSINNPDYIHYNLNSNSNTGLLNSVNRICWGCHTSDALSSDNRVDFSELPQSGHPEGFKAPRNCTVCHKGTVKFNAPLISEHNPAGADLKTTYTCVQCHDNSIRPFIDTQTNISTNTNVSDPDFNIGRVSHYANTSQLQAGGTGSVYCLNCHNNSATGQKYGLNYKVGKHGILDCSACHSAVESQPIQNLHDGDLKKEIPYYISDSDYYCLKCHPPANLVGAHGNLANPANCLNCHMNKTISLVSKKTIFEGARNTNTVFHSEGSRADGYPKALVPGDVSLERGTLEYKRSQCTICHDGAVNHNPDGVCSSCHASNNNNPTWHSTNITGGGGPDCLTCHDSTGSAIHRVDGNSIAIGIHANLNPSSPPDINSKCWGCHQSDGSKPFDSMGDIYNRPYKCIDCHLATGQKAGAYGAFRVDEHYPSGNDVKALLGNGSLEACILCHNKTQMKVNYLSPDNIFTNYSLVSHYGKKRIDMLNATNETKCVYCHQNTSEFNNVFQKLSNTQITHNSGKNCLTCHREQGSLNGRIHDSALAGGGGGPDCINCHRTGGITLKEINEAAFQTGVHQNLNGAATDINKACYACHGDGTAPVEGHPENFTNPKKCPDCHNNGGAAGFFAPVIRNHKPPKVALTQGSGITTRAYCSDCHINSIDTFVYSSNESVSHYGTTADLIRPTVNQTPMPRFGFMNSADARAYNRDCNQCHNPSNPNYGSATLITLAHTPNGTCNQCHVNGNAADLHNSSLSLPVTFGCNECHTTYASRYGAPNLTGTFMANVPGCDTDSCHKGNGDGLFNTLSDDHNRWDRNFAGRGGLTGDVTLNGVQSLSVSRGTLVTIRSRVNDSDSRGGASRVGGAEYYIDTDPGVGKGTPMDPSDGMYDAVNGNWEDVIAVLNTGSLSNGTHTVYVRGMDIGKQWSATRSAVLKIGPPQAAIRNVILEPAVPRAGNEVNITVEIDNPSISFNGRVEGNVWSPSGEGRYLAWEDVVVPAGVSSVTIIGPAGGEESSYKTMEQGIYRYDVFLENVDKGDTYLDATDSRLGIPFNVDSATSVYMSSFNLSVAPTVGNLMTFNVTVTNPTASAFVGNLLGNVWDSTQGHVLPTKSVNVPAGSSAIVTFEFTPIISGTHSYDFFLISDVPADNDKKPFGFICKDYRAAIGFSVG